MRRGAQKLGWAENSTLNIAKTSWSLVSKLVLFSNCRGIGPAKSKNEKKTDEEKTVGPQVAVRPTVD